MATFCTLVIGCNDTFNYWSLCNQTVLTLIYPCMFSCIMHNRPVQLKLFSGKVPGRTYMSPGTKHLALGTSPKPSKWSIPEKKLSKCSSGMLKSDPVGNYDRSLIQKTSPHVCRSELLFKIGAARNLRREQYLSKTPPLFKHLFIYQNVAYNWLAFLEIPNKGFYEPVKCTVM